jgi:hypothetical protein
MHCLPLLGVMLHGVPLHRKPPQQENMDAARARAGTLTCNQMEFLRCSIAGVRCAAALDYAHVAC